MEDKFSTRLPVAGAEVHDLVGGAHDGGFVLDDDDGVPEVAQALEDGDEARGVARVQAHARLVEDVERVDEARAEAGGEVHALGLAAGERARGAVEREVAQADFDEVGKAGTDFFEGVGERGGGGNGE